jgi:hypothetical protein
MTDAEEWQRAARHEAGHIAAHLALQLNFSTAAIFLSDDGTDAIGHVISLIPKHGRISGTRRAVACLAGPVAEARYRNIAPAELLTDPIAETDLAMTIEALRDDLKAPPFAIVFAAAGRLVERQWPIIIRLAGALLRHERLDFDQCRWIAKGRSPARMRSSGQAGFRAVPLPPDTIYSRMQWEKPY